MKVLVTSDQHLGYQNSDNRSFKRFLDQLQQDTTVTDFVFLGDVVDMWRRDASGVFLENWDVIETVMTLRRKMNIYYVAGNHDYHVLRLKNHSYPFTFLKDLTLTDGNWKYRFLHGYEFDFEQQPLFMEALCRGMSDEGGSFESSLWGTLTGDWTDLRYFLFSTLLRSRRSKIRQATDKLQQIPEVRLTDAIDLIEKRAYESVEPGEILVFGHTDHLLPNRKMW